MPRHGRTTVGVAGRGAGRGRELEEAWRCLRTTKVRAAYSRDSQRIGVIERGELVKSIEERTDELGRPQHRLSWPLKGWVSETTSNGDVVFCSAETDDLSSSNDDMIETRPDSRRRSQSTAVTRGRRQPSPQSRTNRHEAEQFVCLNRAPLRVGLDMLSERAGFVEPGDIIRVLDVRFNDKGQRQLRCEAGWVMEYGWTGTQMFQPLDPTAAMGDSSSSSEGVQIAMVVERELSRRQSRSPSPVRHRRRSSSRSPSSPARRGSLSARRRRAEQRSPGGRSMSAGRARRRTRRLSAVGSEHSDVSGDESLVDGSHTEAQAREYFATMLGLAGAITDSHIDKAMGMAAERGLVNAAQCSRIKRQAGRAKIVTAFNIMNAAGSVQHRRSRTAAVAEAQPVRRTLSPRSQQRFVSRMQQDAQQREEYLDQLRDLHSEQHSRRAKYIDRRAHEDLLARMEAHTHQREEELELYRSRPDLVDPHLVFQPTINRRVPSTRRRSSPARSPMRRAESRHLDQMNAARARAASINRNTHLRRPKSPRRTNSPELVPISDKSVLREQIIEIFELHNPAKLDSVDTLIEKYGAEPLLRRMEDKYSRTLEPIERSLRVRSPKQLQSPRGGATLSPKNRRVTSARRRQPVNKGTLKTASVSRNLPTHASPGRTRGDSPGRQQGDSVSTRAEVSHDDYSDESAERIALSRSRRRLRPDSAARATSASKSRATSASKSSSRRRSPSPKARGKLRAKDRDRRPARNAPPARSKESGFRAMPRLTQDQKQVINLCVSMVDRHGTGFEAKLRNHASEDPLLEFFLDKTSDAWKHYHQILNDIDRRKPSNFKQYLESMVLTDVSAVRRALECERIESMDDWDALDEAEIDDLLRFLSSASNIKDRDLGIIEGHLRGDLHAFDNFARRQSTSPSRNRRKDVRGSYPEPEPEPEPEYRSPVHEDGRSAGTLGTRSSASGGSRHIPARTGSSKSVIPPCDGKLYVKIVGGHELLLPRQEMIAIEFKLGTKGGKQTTVPVLSNGGKPEWNQTLEFPVTHTEKIKEYELKVNVSGYKSILGTGDFVGETTIKLDEEFATKDWNAELTREFSLWDPKKKVKANKPAREVAWRRQNGPTWGENCFHGKLAVQLWFVGFEKAEEAFAMGKDVSGCWEAVGTDNGTAVPLQRFHLQQHADSSVTGHQHESPRARVDFAIENATLDGQQLKFDQVLSQDRHGRSGRYSTVYWSGTLTKKTGVLHFEGTWAGAKNGRFHATLTRPSVDDPRVGSQQLREHMDAVGVRDLDLVMDFLERSNVANLDKWVDLGTEDREDILAALGRERRVRRDDIIVLKSAKAWHRQTSSGKVPTAIPRIFECINGDGDARRLFQRYDRDGNGYLSPSELAAALRGMQLDLSDDDVDEIVAFMDTDDDGYVSLIEFMDRSYIGNLAYVREKLIDRAPDAHGAPSFRGLFNRLDRNGDGELNFDEFMKAVRSRSGCDIQESELSRNQLQQLFDHIDVDRNNGISAKEFVDFLENEDSLVATDTGHVVEKTLNYIKEALDEEARRAGKRVYEQTRIAFREMDTDRSGDLDQDELTLAMHKMGLHLRPWEVRPVMIAMDEDGDGSITLDEFMKAMQGELSGPSWSSRELDKKQQATMSEVDYQESSVTSANSAPLQNKPPCAGTLYVTIEGCEDLVPTHTNGFFKRKNYDTSYPYCSASMASVDDAHKLRTAQTTGLDPKFELEKSPRSKLPRQNKTHIKFPIDPRDPQHILFIGVWSYNTYGPFGSDIFIGERKIDLWQTFLDVDWQKAFDGQFNLRDPNKKVERKYRAAKLELNQGDRRGLGSVQVKLHFVPKPGAPRINHYDTFSTPVEPEDVESSAQDVYGPKDRSDELRRELCRRLTSKASDKELERLFTQFNKDKTGQLKPIELQIICKTALRNPTPTEREVEQIYNVMHTKVTAGISLSEFVNFMRGISSISTYGPPQDGTLYITVERCSNLLVADSGIGESSDPYVQLKLGPDGQPVKTKIIKNNVNPAWDDATFEFPCLRSAVRGSLRLQVEVYDWDRVKSDDFLGEYEIDVAETIRLESLEWDRPAGPYYCTLEDNSNRLGTHERRQMQRRKRDGDQHPCGTVVLKFEFVPDPANSPRARDRRSPSAGRSLRLEVDDTTSHHSGRSRARSWDRSSRDEPRKTQSPRSAASNSRVSQWIDDASTSSHASSRYSPAPAAVDMHSRLLKWGVEDVDLVVATLGRNKIRSLGQWAACTPAVRRRVLEVVTSDDDAAILQRIDTPSQAVAVESLSNLFDQLSILQSGGLRTLRALGRPNDGLIKANAFRLELNSMDLSISPEQIDDIMPVVEGDNDGWIQFEEFVELLYSGKVEWLRQRICARMEHGAREADWQRVFRKHTLVSQCMESANLESFLRAEARLSEACCSDDDSTFLFDHLENDGEISFQEFRDFFEPLYNPLAVGTSAHDTVVGKSLTYMSNKLADTGAKPFARIAAKLRDLSSPDGKVDEAGFDDALKGLKLFLPEWQVVLVFAIVDHDGDGLITPQQFVKKLKEHLSHMRDKQATRSASQTSARSPSRARSSSNSSATRRTAPPVIDEDMLDEAVRAQRAGQPRAALQLFEDATDGADLEREPRLQQQLIDIEALVAKSPPGPGVLEVSEIACSKLLPAEGGSSGQPYQSDPYVRFTLQTGPHTEQTKHIINNLSPVFADQILEIDVGDEDTTKWRLLVEVFDKGPDDMHSFLGSLDIDLGAEFKSDWTSLSGVNLHYFLTDPSNRVVARVSTDYVAQQKRAGNKYPYGDVKFHLRYRADSYMTGGSPGAQSIRSAQSSPRGRSPTGSLRGSPPAVTSQLSRTVRDMNAGRTGSGGTVGSPPPIPGHSLDLSGCWEATGTSGQKESFQLLAGSRLPPTEGTLVVSVIQARGLLPTLGSQANTSNPRVKLTYGAQNQQTPVAKKTLSPTLDSWNHPEGLLARFEMKGCAQDAQLGYLQVTPSTFKVLVEVDSIEEKGRWTKELIPHPIGQVTLDLTGQYLFKSGWDQPKDLWFTLQQPIDGISNQAAKRSLQQRRSAGKEDPYGAIHLRVAYEHDASTRRSPPSSRRTQTNWYVGYPSEQSVRDHPNHTFTMSDAKLHSELSRTELEFTATQVLSDTKGQTQWAAEVVENSRGELSMIKGRWNGYYTGNFTAQQTHKL
eukprot:COSAG02_NODE_1372_length_13018_cov_5.358155_1_plen_3167_part_00